MPSVFCCSEVRQKETQCDFKKVTDKILSLRLLREEIEALAKEIWSEFGESCLILQEGNVPLPKRIALWS